MQPDHDRLRVASLLGFLAIFFGSLGAHGSLHDKLVATGELDHWHTAWNYHMPHAIVLVVISLLGSTGGKFLRWSWRCFFLGSLLFSGSLYLLAYTQQKWLVHVTPFGGVTLMLGWLFLAMARWPRA